MNNDIRISTNIMSSPKIKKLIRRCGSEGFVSLVSLWSYVARECPEGDITNLDIDDIEIVSNWNGEPGKFYTTLIELGFIDTGDGKTTIHNWAKRNPWAVGAPERSVSARKARICRHGYSVLPAEKHGSFKSWVMNVLELTANISYREILSLFTNLTPRTTPIPNPEPKPEPKPITTPTPAVEVSAQAVEVYSDASNAITPYGLSAPDFDSLVSYLTAKKVFSPKNLKGLVAEFTQAAKDFGLSVAQCIDCMKVGDWKGFRAEWVGTSKYWKEKNQKQAMSEANANARRQIEKTRAYIRSLDALAACPA